MSRKSTGFSRGRGSRPTGRTTAKTLLMVLRKDLGNLIQQSKRISVSEIVASHSLGHQRLTADDAISGGQVIVTHKD